MFIVDELVREYILARGVVDHDRRVADDRGEVLEGDGEHALSAADAERAEVALSIAANDAVDVLSTVGARSGTGLDRFGFDRSGFSRW